MMNFAFLMAFPMELGPRAGPQAWDPVLHTMAHYLPRIILVTY